MTAILRIINVVVESSSSVVITFTRNLTNSLVPANVSIISQTNNAPNSEVLSVSVSGANLNITCQPLTPFAAYQLQLQSTTNNPFTSVNGDAKISQDGISNVYLISGPISPDNPVSQYLNSFFQGNIYSISDPTTVVSSYLQSIAVNFAEALYDIRQVKNENYLSFTVVDEQHARGVGPFDRLYEEAVYNVLRVGYGPTNAVVPMTFVFPNFPNYPITLQRQLATETIKVSADGDDGTFDVNTLIFNLSNGPITKVDSIVFTLLTGNPVYTYDIATLGYQLLNSTYDQAYASSYLLLANNQVKINEAILLDPLFSIDRIFSITIQYEYKGLGINISPTSVDIYTTLQSIRENLPPIENVFNLQHAPITNASNGTVLTGGLVLTDPNSNTGAPHPAFITEIPFSLSALPAIPGIYAVDYATGTVYVYGATSLNDGTGPSPPLATYYYRYTFVSEIDYVYDPETYDVVALPNGNLINQAGTVGFDFEQVLIPGVDYNANTHIEAINEQVNNNVIALNALTTINSPITNVFQIYNQSSGEIYTLDRWNDNIVYFLYNSPPTISQEIGENATFNTITNELLTVNTTTTNIGSLTIFIIYLANNTIISATQDCIASSINTSLVFSNGNVFVSERWYNQEFDAQTNYNNLKASGQYMVDYTNGIVYLVAPSAPYDLATTSYKVNSIVPDFLNIVSVDDIYYRISPLTPKNKHFAYDSFGAGSIIVNGLDVSDEGFLNGTQTSPYQYLNGVIGAFVGDIFVPGVSNAVDFVRGVFEFNDIVNNPFPINFANVSTSSNFNIAVGAIVGQTFQTVQFDGTHYFVILNENISYLSPGITFTFSIVRTADGAQLWNSSGTIVLGNPVKLILPGIGSPSIGNFVSINYSFAINPIERVIVDYNKGDFYVDYTYVADILLVSYEYGDNVIDWRQNTNLPSGSQYYVSYQVGALRDSLLKNFGTLVNVPTLDTFDLSLDRERYREGLYAALSSFVQGPTIAAIKNIGQIISHIEPQVIESALMAWSLGTSLLFPDGIETTGAFQLLPAHFGNGVLVNQPGQTITMPMNSSLRLEEGTFETWILPQWNGLDNDAELTFTITRDGSPINPYQVFIGGSEYHPTISGGVFSLNNEANVSGLPNTNKDGIFIYYGNDPSNSFQQWYVEVIDGYVALDTHTYKLNIASSGKFYDLQYLGGNVKSPNVSTFTGTNFLNITISTPSSGYLNEGVSFISDNDHYLLDFGLSSSANRLSIFKDVSGYMNFRVFDCNGTAYIVSADIASWKVNVPHMVAASWKLNTRNSRDEMHLFIDGFEVPNIIKYGQKLQPYLHENFRTVDPETIVGLSNRDIVGSDDLTTTAGTQVVSSSINFSAFNIHIGDTIFINEIGFSSTGYTIDGISGQTLTLNTVLPISLPGNGRYSVNQTNFDVSSDINIAPNITVSTIHSLVSNTDLHGFIGSATFSSASSNFIADGVLPGFLLRIDNSAYNLTYSITAVSTTTLTITDVSPINLSGATFQIYPNALNELPGVRALDPDYSIGTDANFDNILTISNGVLANDLIVINTLGLNFRDVSKRYYVWSTETENVLMTRLPPPISLDEADITKIILPITVIGPINSTLVGGIFLSTDLPTAQPSNAQNGRTIQATVSGSNVDFTTPVSITINGRTGMTVISETITFSNYGTLNFANAYTSLNYIQVDAKPLNPAKNACAVQVREFYPITYSEFSGLAPIVRFSYQIDYGFNLSADGYDGYVSDYTKFFSALDIGNYLVINSPPSVAGFYLITALSTDRHSVLVQATYASEPVPLTSFTGGLYSVLNVNQYRSGLQNGFFTFEASELPGQAYFLSQGFYLLNYSTYASIKMAPLNTALFFGTDFTGNNIANAILDQSTIYSIMLTDTRIGEVVASNQRSITKDFNSLTPPPSSQETLVIIDFDTFPFANDAETYSNTNNDHIHFQSDWAVNDNFGQSLVVLDQPIILPNAGILNTSNQGTIEFWMSPLYDTANDPQERYYFDAYSAIVEEVASVNNVSVKVSSPVGQVLKVALKGGDPNIDYFAGGKVEIDTQQAIQEEGRSVGVASVLVSQPILQVITVKIVGDFTGKDYFNNGQIGSDNQTIYLGTPLPQPNLQLVIIYQSTNNDDTTINTQVIRLNKRLPAQNSQVIVSYIPARLQGDRISIFKDCYGYMNFSITASGITYTVLAPTFWARNTWHRVKASYQLNGGVGQDQMRLFLDGYQYTDAYFGSDLTFGQFPAIMGSVSVGDGYASLISSITFKDPINTLFIGTDYANTKPIYTLLQNFRISDINRPIYAPYGEPIDVNFSSNLGIVFPVQSDLYTTYLMNSAVQNALNITNFTTLVDRNTGAFDFTVNIDDSFGIVSSSPQVKEILENLIEILMPANCQVSIKYISSESQ